MTRDMLENKVLDIALVELEAEVDEMVAAKVLDFELLELETKEDVSDGEVVFE